MLPFFWHLREHSISKNLSNTEDFLQIKHLIYATCCRGAYSKTCTIMQSNSPAKSGLFQRQCCSLCLGRGTIKGWGRFAPRWIKHLIEHSLHPTVIQEVAWGGIQVVWGAFPPGCQILPVESLICLTASLLRHRVKK